MVGRGTNIGTSKGEISSSSSSGVFGEVPSCKDADRVLIWLKPVRDSQADAFQKIFSFPPKYGYLFSTSGPQFVALHG